MDQSSISRSQTTCPRCGYDLRGVTATWQENCPLEGTCSECGLELRWAEVFFPKRYEPQWCVEFAPGGRKLPRACRRTLVRSFWPLGFWSRVQMTHSIRPRRLMAYVSWLAVLLLLCYALVQASVAIAVQRDMQQGIDMAVVEFRAMLKQTPLDPQDVAAYQQFLASLPKIEFSLAGAIAEAVLTPWARASNGTISSAQGSSPYIPPVQLWPSLGWVMGGMFGAAPKEPPRLAAILTGLFLGALLMLLMPLEMALLPVSRRRAKVRWRHIGRVVVYGLFISVSIVILCAAITITGLLLDDSVHRWTPKVAWLAPPVMLWAWWGAAINRYMKIGHGHITAALFMILSIALIVAVMYLLWPKMVVDHALQPGALLGIL